MYKVKYCAYVFVFCVSSGKFNLSFGGGILINLIDGWYIDADSNCYAVHKIIPADEKSISPSGKGDPEKDSDTIYGYFTSMQSLVSSVIKGMLRDKVAKDEITSLSQFKNELLELKKQIEELIVDDVILADKSKVVPDSQNESLEKATKTKKKKVVQK